MRELDQEMTYHLDLEIQKNLRAGMSPEEARRQAHISFGGVERYKQQTREARAFAWIGGASLDMKLGVRMLIKHPALAILGGFGMALGIAIGSASFAVTRSLSRPWLPGDDEHRMVAIRSRDLRTGFEARGTYLHDLDVWRRGLPSIEDLGVYRVVRDRSMVLPDGRIEPLVVVELSALALDLLRVPALIGRTFDEADEEPGATPVAVIGYDLWRDKFATDASVVGHRMGVSGVEHTIVGVMPEGFAFPVNHNFWTPLRLSSAVFPSGGAPAVNVVARMRPGIDIGRVRAEATAVQQGLIAVEPGTHANLRAIVVPLARTEFESPEELFGLHLFQLMMNFILVIIGMNVAILVYARTASRIGEIAIRTALGGSRTRVVAQLFSEALVLSAISALIGLGAARYVLGAFHRYLTFLGGDEMPFWWTFRIDAVTVLYVVALALAAAVIVGIIPALKATGRRVNPTLQHVSASGSGLLLGRTWTLLIVAQVAIAVVLLPIALGNLTTGLLGRVARQDFSTSSFLTAELTIERQGFGADRESDAELAARLAPLQAEVIRRLEADPAVSHVVRTNGAPITASSATVAVEGPPPQSLEQACSGPLTCYFSGQGTASTFSTAAFRDFVTSGLGQRVALARVDANFFRAFGVGLLAGREFRPEDLTGQSNAVIVNRSFVERRLFGIEPLGRRFRDSDMGRECAGCEGANPWLEIVGVVEDFPSSYGFNAPIATFYRPMPERGAFPLTLNISVRGVAPEAYAERLRQIAFTVDPTISVRNAAPLDDALADNTSGLRLLTTVLTLLPLSAVLLSGGGIAALMAFTVAQRRREIGIRLALGASGLHVLGSVLSRAARQIGTGVLLGLSLIALLLKKLDQLNLEGAGMLASVVAVVSIVGLAATLAPVRSGMKIQPTEALKGE